jgi:DNA polymerase III subunit epsilon
VDRREGCARRGGGKVLKRREGGRACGAAGSRRYGSKVKKEADTDRYDETIDRLAALVEAHPDYRVLRRIVGFPQCPAPEGAQLRCGLLVDLETTSLEVTKAQILEAGMVLFKYTQEGAVCEVLDTYQGLNDPGIPIPDEASAVNSISQEMVRGKQLDSVRIAELANRAQICLAHSAGFDRMIIERFFPYFADKPWGCSYRQVPWRDLGFSSAKLDYLLNGFGLFHEEHRALEDCRALLHLLAQGVGGGTVLSLLLANARKETQQLWAVEAPFEAKDLLYARNYRWNCGSDGRLRAWHRELPEEEVPTELDWLEKEIYRGKGVRQVVRQRVTAYERFSARG